jgi:hypothetical protein
MTRLSLALFAAAVVSLSGCSKEQPLKEITAAEIVAGAPEAFQGAPADVQTLAAEAAEAISKQEFPTAWDRLQALNGSPNLTDAQKEFIATSIATVGAEMNKAEESGNEAAQEALKFHRANK